MKNNFKKAFSLIEISIVILVVGVLIAGISRGLKMAYYEMRLVTARSLTDKAPVPNVEGLELWLETTAENSLAIGTASFVNIKKPEDGQPIGRWNDLNPMALNSSYKNHAVQATSGYQPLYMKDGINGLPALLFDGLDDYFYANDGKTNFIEFTIFMVFFSQPKSTSTSEYGTLINIACRGWTSACQLQGTASGYSTVSGGGNPIVWIFVSLYNNNLVLMQSKISGAGYSYSSYGVSMINNIPRISKINYNNVNINMSINPKQNSTSATSPLITGNDYLGFRIGTQKGNGGLSGNRNYKGYIGEIILFSRSLNDQETKLIENYLSEKWRINL